MEGKSLAALIVIGRVIAVMTGLGFLSVAAFVRTDEANKIHNRLEEWWIRLDDSRKASDSKVNRFVTRVAGLMTNVLDRLFGLHLLSTRALCVSACVSLIGILFYELRVCFGTGLLILEHHSWAIAPMMLGRTVKLGLYFVTLSGLVGVRSWSKSIKTPRLWFIAVGIVLATIFLDLNYVLLGDASEQAEREKFGGGEPPPYGAQASALTLTLLASALVDFATVVWVRKSLAWIRGRYAFLAAALVVVVNMVAGVLFTHEGRMLRWQDRFSPDPWSHATHLFWEANILNLNLLSLFLFGSAVMIVHEGAWSVLERGVYSLQDRRVVDQKKSLMAMGLFLVVVAFPDLGRWVKGLVIL